MLHGDPIRVLVVDDSILTRRVICAALETAPDITVVGTASIGPECLAAAKKLSPDVVTLDVEMPGMDGLEVLRRLLQQQPCRVLMVSYLTRAGAETTVRAMLAGAVDFVAKPGGPIMRDLAGLRDELIRKVRAAARARLPMAGRPTPALRPVPSKAPTPTAVRPIRPPLAGWARGGESFDRLVVIGASTGGPRALETVLSGLTPDATTAYLLVQHMPGGMTPVLAELLDESSPLTVREARTNDRLAPGTALLTPGDFHARLGPGGMIQLDQGPKVHYVRPSVDVALLSAAELYGDRTIATVLTGIGVDGADGAAAVHAAGGYVIAEAESTAVVWSMPRAVAERGAADAVVSLPDVARAITTRLSAAGRPRERLRA